MSSEINKVLAERGVNYGDFAFVAFRSKTICVYTIRRSNTHRLNGKRCK